MSAIQVGFVRLEVYFPYWFIPYAYTTLKGWRLWLCLLLAGYYPFGYSEEDFPEKGAWAGSDGEGIGHLVWVLNAWGLLHPDTNLDYCLDDILF